MLSADGEWVLFLAFRVCCSLAKTLKLWNSDLEKGFVLLGVRSIEGDMQTRKWVVEKCYYLCMCA